MFIIFDNRYLYENTVFFCLLLLTGCSTVSPVTWDKRVKNNVAKPVILAYEEQGQKNAEVILLLHGFAESRFTWRYIAKDLSQKYRVMSIDLKGFGESPKPKDGGYSIYDQAIAVRYFIQSHGLQNVTLVGHSMGGGVALALTLMADEVDKTTTAWSVERLVLLGSAAYKQNLPVMLRDLNRPIIGRLGAYLMPAYYQAIEGYRFAFYNDKNIPAEGVAESAKNFSLPGSRYVFLQTARQLIPDDIDKISQKYPTIKQPVLIIWGDKDRVVPLKYGVRLHKDLPHSRLEILSNVGHMSQEEAPVSVLRLIRSFMQAENLL